MGQGNRHRRKGKDRQRIALRDAAAREERTFVHSASVSRTDPRRREPSTSAAERPRSTGIVARFMDEKGFGFIKPDAGGKDVFFHFSAIVSQDRFKTLPAGAKVEFDLLENPKGPRADAVRVVQ